MGWAVACGVISTVVALVMLIPQSAAAVKQFAKFIYLFLLFWWIAGVTTLTYTYKGSKDAYWQTAIFSGSYANGYFGCWGALFASVVLTMNTFGGGGGGGGGGGSSAPA